VRLRRVFAALTLTLVAAPTFAADPFASNNGFYPDPATRAWTGPYRTSNYNYPVSPPDNGWTRIAPRRPLTPESAGEYARRLKEFVAPALRDMIEKPDSWSSTKAGWYDMIWQGQGADPSEGREAILGAFSGQVILKDTFASSGLTVDMQNHTVIYYDAMAAGMLHKLWANPFNPNRSVVSFPEGAMVVKAGAVTPTPLQWPVVDGATIWNVFRPPVSQIVAHNADPKAPLTPVVTPVRLLQFDIIVKDSVAAPQTGWVFSTFIYDRSAPGAGTWDKLVPLGAMWGNDPEYARSPTGRGPNNEPLRETWINPQAPRYAAAGLGWGGRLSGPIDVAQRHNVLLANGTLMPKLQASSCFSCHGTAQSPFVANLYPSPNRSFPPEGTLFPMFVPGSEDWSRWYQSRPGSVAQNPGSGTFALDYDMLIMFAIGAFDAAAGADTYLQGRPRLH
jgi:hypothetical protein